ncbi:hypothetical protein HDV00_000378 [Rhizophlyctis rosea]|nr:hypothetical protein HDV00_000378 [Rhizophlyctis rosea]
MAMMDVQSTYSTTQLLAAAASSAIDIPQPIPTLPYLQRTQSQMSLGNYISKHVNHSAGRTLSGALDASATKHSATAPTTSHISHMGTSPTSSTPSSPCQHRQCQQHSSSDTIRIAKQNRKRLQLLRNTVMQSPAGFLQGCEELRMWCDDRRAYLPELANELDKTLKFVAEKAIVDNYDLDAGMSVMDVVQKWKRHMVAAAADNHYQYVKFLQMHQQARIHHMITCRTYYAPTPSPSHPFATPHPLPSPISLPSPIGSYHSHLDTQSITSLDAHSPYPHDTHLYSLVSNSLLQQEVHHRLQRQHSQHFETQSPSAESNDQNASTTPSPLGATTPCAGSSSSSNDTFNSMMDNVECGNFLLEDGSPYASYLSPDPFHEPTAMDFSTAS